ncbi:unnamed protein product [Phyllotreta striolata]|uniref:Amidase domain-containing protein n=1 Tax=Phyllotreta striolata TaxID=444603 RepID=A0A9N9TTW1_PHYSR|nr:unnamed protein product [Phyllotreta striolata]
MILSRYHMETVFYIMLFVVKISSKLLGPVIRFAAKGKKQVLPPIANDIIKISATDLAEKIRKREISTLQICKAYIARISEVNPFLNAITEERFYDALKEAQEIDDFLSTTKMTSEQLAETKPLLGIPITVKESCSVKGMELSVGNLALSGTKASEDGAAVARLRSKGAIPLLVSTTPEFCFSTVSENKTRGKTNNPYDTTCTTGGSSSGEGALVGSGASIVGIGSDLGGSVRIPAGLCGVFGHKATGGVASSDGHFPATAEETKYFSAIGPLVRYAKDLKLVMNALVEPQHVSKLKLNQQVDLNDIEIAIMEDMNHSSYPETDPEIKAALQKAAMYLQKKFGSKIVNDKIEGLTEVTNIASYTIIASEKGEEALNHPAPLWEFIKGLFGSSDFSTPFACTLFQTRVLALLLDYKPNELIAVREKIWKFFGNNRILLIPTSFSSAKKHEEYLFSSLDIAYTVFANSCGLPATTVPCGLNKKKMPFGIQVIAGPYQDRICLAVAEELEKCFGGWTPPSKYM